MTASVRQRRLRPHLSQWRPRMRCRWSSSHGRWSEAPSRLNASVAPVPGMPIKWASNREGSAADGRPGIPSNRHRHQAVRGSSVAMRPEGNHQPASLIRPIRSAGTRRTEVRQQQSVGAPIPPAGPRPAILDRQHDRAGSRIIAPCTQATKPLASRDSMLHICSMNKQPKRKQPTC